MVRPIEVGDPVERNANFPEFAEHCGLIGRYCEVLSLIRLGNHGRSILAEDWSLSWHPCQSSWSALRSEDRKHCTRFEHHQGLGAILVSQHGCSCGIGQGERLDLASVSYCQRQQNHQRLSSHHRSCLTSRGRSRWRVYSELVEAAQPCLLVDD